MRSFYISCHATLSKRYRFFLPLLPLLCLALLSCAPAARAQVSVGNGGFETPSVGSHKFRYDPNASPWRFNPLTYTFRNGRIPNGSGISANGSAFTAGNPNAPAGGQVAFLQGTGHVSQVVSGFSATAVYVLTLSAAQRLNHQPGGRQSLRVYLNSKLLAAFTPTGGTYSRYSTSPFQASASRNTITIAGVGTHGDSTALVDAVSLTTLPAAPTGLSARAGDQRVALTWHTVSGATSYNVKRSTRSGGPYTKVNMDAVTSASYIDTGLTNGTAYYYVVTAVNSGGESRPSSQAAATPSLPPGPLGLMALPGNQQVTLSWSPVPNVTGYNVYRSTQTSGGYARIPGSPFSDMTCTDTGLTNGTMYFYVVTAITGSGESEKSDPVDAMPIAPDFSLSASPRSVGIVQGMSQDAAITTMPIGGFQEAVSLSLDDAPPGISGTFSTTSATSSSLSIAVASVVTPGLYHLTVTGTSGSLTHSFTLPLTVTPPPSLTASQAIQIAQTFCQAIGAPVTGTAAAQYPASARYTSQQDTYWLPRWLVTFTGTNGLQAEVDVVDSTGSVSRYYNFALSQQTLAANQPAGTPIVQATAISTATAALQAAGQPSDIAATPTSQNFQMTSPATSAGDLWMVTWPRQFQGIPYRNQQVTVMLQGETGAVQALSVAFPSPPPTSGAGQVTQDQATATALALLQNAGVQSLTPQATQQEVVQPNTSWQPGGSVQPPPNVAGQVAWDCYFTDANSVVYEVWVDTNSGAVIGGESYTTAGKHRPAVASKTKTVKAAQVKPAKPKRKR